MSKPSPRQPVKSRRLSTRLSLLAGISSMALIVATAGAEAGNLRRSDTTSVNNAAAVAAARANASAQAAARAALAARGAFNRANEALAAMRAAQVAARSIAVSAASNVPNGLRAGGLVIADGALPTPTDGGSGLWQGAELPTEAVADGHHTVTVEQTEQKAILTWDSFNIGKDTTLAFQQDDAGWIALNRVMDPTQAPSRIEGAIQADGHVYVINRNGILFGGSSQVDVGTLVASSLSLSNEQFMAGINTRLLIGRNNSLTTETKPTFGEFGDQFSFSPDAEPFVPGDPAGAVTVEAGAQIDIASGGKAMLFAPHVTNAGSISAADGQVILAAGENVYLNESVDVRGFDVTVSAPSEWLINAFHLNKVLTGNWSPGEVFVPYLAEVIIPAMRERAATVGYRVTNDGVVTSSRGDITLQGREVVQAGALYATTALNNRSGSVRLQAWEQGQTEISIDDAPRARSWAAGSLTLDGTSLTLVAPDLTDTGEIEGTAVATRYEPGRVELRGMDIRVASGADVIVPSGDISAVAAADPLAPADAEGSVGGVRDASLLLIEDGAYLGTAGLTGVELDMDANVVEAELRIAELADSVLYRDSWLRGETVYVDRRASGAFKDGPMAGVQWIGDQADDAGLWLGTPLANVSAWIGVGNTNLAELSTVGGTIRLKSGGSLILRQGSTLDVSGGAVSYRSGWVTTTKLLGADGRVYDIAEAMPDIDYVGFADDAVVIHERWGQSQRYRSLRAQASRYEQGYVEGRDAGAITILAGEATVLEGSLHGGVITGDRQARDGTAATAGTLNLGDGTNDNRSWIAHDIVISQAPPRLADDLTNLDAFYVPPTVQEDFALPLVKTVHLDQEMLNASGMGRLNFHFFRSFTVAEGADVQATAGADILIDANTALNETNEGNVVIAGRIGSAGGSVAMRGGLNTVTLGGDSAIDLRGQWINGHTPDGPAVLDGGTLVIDAQVIDAAEGARIDVSGGGWVQPNGGGADVTAGDAGAITLDGIGARSLSNLELTAYAAGSGGSLTIATDQAVRLGGDAPEAGADGADTVLHIGGTLYTDRGFRALRVEAPDIVVPEGAELVQAPTSVDLRGVDLLATASGTPVEQAGRLAVLPLHRRAELAGTSLDLVGPRIAVGTGAAVRADVGGSVRLYGDQVLVDGTIAAPAGRIDLLGGSQGGFSGTLTVTDASRLLAPGVPVTYVDSQGHARGKVLDGGTVRLSAGQYTIGEDTVIDVSGASARVTVGSGRSRDTAPVRIDSDGGAIAFQGGGVIRGDLRAAAGGPDALGGRLSVAMGGAGGANPLDPLISDLDFFAGFGGVDANGDGAVDWRDAIGVDLNALFWGLLGTEVIIPQAFFDAFSSSFVVAETAPADAGGGGPLDPEDFGITATMIDALASWGFADVRDVAAGAADLPGGATLVATELDGAGFADLSLDGGGRPVQFDGAELSLARQIAIAGPIVNAGGDGSTLSAPHILLTGAAAGTAAASLDGVLRLDASVIDIDGSIGIRGFAETRLEATDIRMDAPIGLPSLLTADGTLTIAAAQLYPTTQTTATVAAGEVIRVERNGTAAAPLSAGGTLTLEAPVIEQGGTLRAPFGAIVLKAGERLTIADGSTTSVAGDGLVASYGFLRNGDDWMIERRLGEDDTPITAPPEKRIELDAPEVDIAAGSVIDVRGGGDLHAAGHVPGPGGSHDILDMPGLHAIVPSHAVAPSVSGQRVWLAGGGGLAAGWYTLLPARYALLPGAYAVQAVAGSQGMARTAAATLPDSSLLMAGRLGDAYTGTGRGLSATWRVLSGEVVRRYSEYSEALANDYFASDSFKLAQSRRTGVVPVTPRLPNDGGSLVLKATRTLVLDGQVRSDVAADGRGGLIDIAAGRIAVVGAGHDRTGLDDYLVIDAGALSRFGADSLLLGGTRQGDPDGLRLDVVASDLEVRNDADSALTGPEIILAASERIVVAAGSVLEASGDIAGGAGDLIMSPQQPERIDDQGNSWPGDDVFVPARDWGSVIRLSNGDPVRVRRQNVDITTGGLIDIGAGAVLDGGRALLVDATRDTQAAQARLGAAALSLGAGSIGFGGGSGLVLDADAIAALGTAEALTLRSYSTIDFHQSVDLSGLASVTFDSAGLIGFGTGDIAVDGTVLVLENTSSSLVEPAGAGSGRLTLTAERVVLGEGDKALRGFDRVALTGTDGIVGRGLGTLDAGTADVTLATPVLTGRDTANQSLTTGGDLLLAATGTPSSLAADDSLGSVLSLSGGNVTLSGAIVARGGAVAATATAGDLVLTDGASIDVGGFGKTFYDVTDYVDAGAITLGAVGGDLRLNAGADLLLAGADGGGAAGRLALVSAGGDVVLDGTIDASAADGQTAGAFAFNTDTLADFSGLNRKLDEAGFFAAREFRVRSGDVVVDGVTRAERFRLAADSGTVTVTGTIDARATYGGDIAIAGGGGLIVDADAVLMAGATDSVDGLGSGRVLLDAGAGLLDVRGATIDVAGGEGGKVRLRARRTATNDGVRVARLDADIRGARSAVLEGVAVYDATAHGTVDAVWDQAVAEANAFHAAVAPVAAGIDVMAGIEIRSDGDLAVSRDLDLYASFATAREGGLTLRAAGDLTIAGNISDGFSAADDSGVLQNAASWDLRLVAGADLASADMLAVAPSAALAADAGSLVVGAEGAGNTVRTGTGDLHAVAGRDLVLADFGSVIYTAGRADSTVYPDFDAPAGAVYGIDGGHLSLAAQGDVIAAVPSDKGQAFADWLYRQGWVDGITGEMTTRSSWWVNHATFDTGVGALGGGNVTVTAGGDLVDLGVYQPTNARLRGPRAADADKALELRNGGHMAVTAGGAIRGGQYFIGRGEARIEADTLTGGRMVTESRQNGRFVVQHRFAPLLALGDATMTVQTTGDLRISTVAEPMMSRLDTRSTPPPQSFMSGHTERTAIDLKSSGGDLILDNDIHLYLARDTAFPSFSGSIEDTRIGGGLNLFPAKTRLTALNGTVRNHGWLQTMPADTGELRILAAGDIHLGDIVMGRAVADFVPSPFNPYMRNDSFSRENMTRLLRNDLADRNFPTGGNPDVLAMQEHDFEPSRFYSLDGSITGVNVATNEQTWLQAGLDIRATGDRLRLRNLRPTDTSLLHAGRDIVLGAHVVTTRFEAGLTIQGPGGLMLAAGRDVVGLAPVAHSDVNLVYSLANASYDHVERRDPFSVVNALPDQGAEIAVLAGLAGQQPDYDAFTAAYVDPANVGAMPDHLTTTVDGVVMPAYLVDKADDGSAGAGRLERRGLVSFIEEVTGDRLAPLDAWARFQTLPALTRQRFVRRVYMQELRDAGRGRNLGDQAPGGGYQRGYDAIEVLFPGDGWHGDVLLRGGALRTQSGGDIQVLAPGGGFQVASLNQTIPAGGGVITLDSGHIQVFTHDNTVINGSRMLTFGGGDVVVWSTRGDIDAGRGAKTTRVSSAPDIVTDPDGVTTIQERTDISGSGIGTVIGFAGVTPGDVDLVAPEGVVDAGDGGIRVSGDFNVAARVVLNVDNIQVGGESQGVPAAEDAVIVVNVEAGDEGQQAAQDAAQDAAGQAADRDTDLPSIITVVVVGYGGDDEEDSESSDGSEDRN